MHGTKSYPLTSPAPLWEVYRSTLPSDSSININDGLVGTVAHDVLQLRGDELEREVRSEFRELIVRDRDLDPLDGDPHVRQHEE